MTQVQNFGEPFFLVVRENETLAEVKVRVQNKLQVSDDEFSKVWFYPSWSSLRFHFNIINLVLNVSNVFSVLRTIVE